MKGGLALGSGNVKSFRPREFLVGFGLTINSNGRRMCVFHERKGIIFVGGVKHSSLSQRIEGLNWDENGSPNG